MNPPLVRSTSRFQSNCHFTLPSIGTSLVSLGRAHCQIATLQETFAISFEDTYLKSIRRSEADIKEYQNERKKLDSRRYFSPFSPVRHTLTVSFTPSSCYRIRRLGWLTMPPWPSTRNSKTTKTARKTRKGEKPRKNMKLPNFDCMFVFLNWYVPTVIGTDVIISPRKTSSIQ